jgi:hypothetical protein
MNKLGFPIKAGLLAGFILIAFSIIMYALDTNILGFGMSMLNLFVSFAILIVAALMGTAKMRDIDYNFKINYLQALIGCFVTLLLAMYITGIFSYVLNGIIDPDYMPRKVDGMLDSYERLGVPEEALDEIITKMETQIDPAKQLIRSLWVSPLVALGLSALLALFVKKDKTTTTNI